MVTSWRVFGYNAHHLKLLHYVHSSTASVQCAHVEADYQNLYKIRLAAIMQTTTLYWICKIKCAVPWLQMRFVSTGPVTDPCPLDCVHTCEVTQLTSQEQPVQLYRSQT